MTTAPPGFVRSEFNIGRFNNFSAKSKWKSEQSVKSVFSWLLLCSSILGCLGSNHRSTRACRLRGFCLLRIVFRRTLGLGSHKRCGCHSFRSIFSQQCSFSFRFLDCKFSVLAVCSSFEASGQPLYNGSSDHRKDYRCVCNEHDLVRLALDLSPAHGLF